MRGTPIGNSTRVEKTDSGHSRRDKRYNKKRDIHAKISASLSHAKDSAPQKREASADASKRERRFDRQRSSSSPTLTVTAGGSPSPASRRPLPPINLDLLSVKTPAVVERKPMHRGPPPGPWNLSKSPHGHVGLGAPLPEWISGSTLEDLVTQAESLRSKVEESRALYAAWWLMYEHFPKNKPTHDEVAALHQQLKEATETGGWAIHDELNRAQALLHVIEGRIEKPNG